jgi:ribosomal protein S10
MSKLRIRLTAFYPDRLDYCAREIVETVKRTGGLVKGPIPLPNKTRKLTVLSSPHVDKDARDQFQTTEHRRLIIVYAGSMDTMNQIELPPEVKVTIEREIGDN